MSTNDSFNPPEYSTPISKKPVSTKMLVEFQHNESKQFLSKFGKWYRVGGDFNRDMLPPEVGRVPFPYKLAPIEGEERNLLSGDMVRIQTTQTMPPNDLTMIGVVPGQDWSLCCHWGDTLLQFYYTKTTHSEFQIHLKDGAPGQQIFFGDIVLIQKLNENPAFAGWMQRTEAQANNEYHVDLVSGKKAPESAEWVIYPDRSN